MLERRRVDNQVMREFGIDTGEVGAIRMEMDGHITGQGR